MIKRIQCDCVEADVVVDVGHIAPVRFQLEAGAVAAPYSLPPWTPESCGVDIPAVQWLRGDFFGFPFGVSEGIEHVHGSAANGPWQLVDVAENALNLALNLPELGGRIEKRIELRDGHRVLYNQHTISGVTGRYNYGHHPVLQIPEGVTVEMRTSAFKFGSVYPGAFGDPAAGETCVLKPGAEFDSLEQVPLTVGGALSLAQYPSATRHEDLVMLSAAEDVTLGWTAVSYPGYVWISIRSTVQFPSTLFWLSNGGRAQAPWNGQHDRRIGIEDVCSYFHEGAHISSTEPLAARGIQSSQVFKADQPTVLRHAQMVVPTDGQQAVAAIEPIPGQGAVCIRFEDGSQTNESLDWQWLKETDTL
jgi:hypothetical protein